MSGVAVRAEGLRKLYGEKVAVSDLTLEVRQGEVFGFLGPNGSGKTTSVKMFLGLVRPTAGRGELLGRPLGVPAARARVGFLPEHFRFHDWLTATEFLSVHAGLYGIPASESRPRIPALLERVGLSAHAGKRLREFSKGMLQRVGLAQAMLPEPLAVFLDEPTSGLDPGGRLLVRDILHELRDRGATVFLNSHLLGEVEATCDRVAFVKEGVVIRTGTLAELAEEATVEVRLGAPPGPDVLDALRTRFAAVDAEGPRLVITLRGKDDVPEAVRLLVARGAEVHAVLPRRRTLEEVFVETVGKEGGL